VQCSFCCTSTLDAGPESAPRCAVPNSSIGDAQPPPRSRGTGSKETPGYLDIAILISLWLFSCASDCPKSTIKTSKASEEYRDRNGQSGVGVSALSCVTHNAQRPSACLQRIYREERCSSRLSVNLLVSRRFSLLGSVIEDHLRSKTYSEEMTLWLHILKL
jgi:hypothetical protein